MGCYDRRLEVPWEEKKRGEAHSRPNSLVGLPDLRFSARLYRSLIAREQQMLVMP